jgi:hypothetical protein
MQPLQKSILKVAAYFDMFDYPVTLDEIKLFLEQPFKERELLFEIQQLLDYNVLYKMNDFFALRYDWALLERRIKGNAKAAKNLKLAATLARFLSWFPYVRGVAISGSLSKNFAYEGSDIDFFLVTAPNRLWIARTFLVCFQKLAILLGMKNWFCLNYYIDSTATEIPEKNIYTAIEIATLMPKQGKQVFDNFYAANKWISKYLPNYLHKDKCEEERKGPAIKRITEWLLNSKAGDKLDNWLVQFYKKRWAKMMTKKRFAKNGFQFGSCIAAKHACKPMPQYFQGKILGNFEKKLQEIDAVYCTPQQVAV